MQCESCGAKDLVNVSFCEDCDNASICLLCASEDALCLVCREKQLDVWNETETPTEPQIDVNLGFRCCKELRQGYCWKHGQHQDIGKPIDGMKACLQNHRRISCSRCTRRLYEYNSCQWPECRSMEACLHCMGYCPSHAVQGRCGFCMADMALVRPQGPQEPPGHVAYLGRCCGQCFGALRSFIDCLVLQTNRDVIRIILKHLRE